MEDLEKNEVIQKRDRIWNALYFLQSKKVDSCFFIYENNSGIENGVKLKFSDCIDNNIIDMDLLVKNTIVQLQNEVNKLNAILNSNK